MADDWRLTVEIADADAAREISRWLHELQVENGDSSFGRVIVSRDDRTVFLYADTEARARSVGRILLARLGHPAEGRVALTRWHPVEQRWEDAGVPLPRTEEELQAEHERRQAREAAESAASGEAEWEVRVELPDHGATVALAERLEGEGIPVTRRYTFLLVGAANEDQAHRIAERLEAEAPDGARIEVEPGGRMVWEVAPQNPFAVFGGFGM